MNLLSRHLTGLLDFSGRENRQPFWLWVLIIYVTQMIVGAIAAVPLMSSYFQAIDQLVGMDKEYLDAHPEIAMQTMMNAIGPMMTGIMILSVVLSLIWAAMLGAAVVRRLHDSERSGWWSAPVFAIHVTMPIVYAAVFPGFFKQMAAMRPGMTPDEINAGFMPMMPLFWTAWLVGMIGFALMILLIVFLCLPGTVGPNRFGDDPLRPPFH